MRLRLVGPRGATIKDIEQRSGAGVQMPKTEKFAPGGRGQSSAAAPVMVTGTAEAVSRAKDLINGLLGTQTVVCLLMITKHYFQP